MLFYRYFLAIIERNKRDGKNSNCCRKNCEKKFHYNIKSVEMIRLVEYAYFLFECVFFFRMIDILCLAYLNFRSNNVPS